MLIVCIAHFFHLDPFHSSLGFLTNYFKGDTGVYIFYVLSGYLVTGILAREVSNHTHISVRLKAVGHFFGRRIFRLQPSHLLFLGFYFILPIQLNALRPSVLFFPLSNWYDGPYITWHLKTLHVEETYYATIGIAILILGNRLKSLMWFLLISAPIGRIFIYFIGKYYSTSMQYFLDTFLPIEAFATGGLLSLYFLKIKEFKIFKFISKFSHFNFIFSILALLIIGMLRPIKPFSYLLYFTWPLLFSILSAVMIVSGLENKSFQFSARWLAYLGLLSYSVYLFQQFVLGPWQEIYHTSFSWTDWGLLASLIVVVLPLWYKFGEKPITEFGSRLFPRVQPGAAVPVDSPRCS